MLWLHNSKHTCGKLNKKNIYLSLTFLNESIKTVYNTHVCCYHPSPHETLWRQSKTSFSILLSGGWRLTVNVDINFTFQEVCSSNVLKMCINVNLTERHVSSNPRYLWYFSGHWSDCLSTEVSFNNVNLKVLFVEVFGSKWRLDLHWRKNYSNIKVVLYVAVVISDFSLLRAP